MVRSLETESRAGQETQSSEAKSLFDVGMQVTSELFFKIETDLALVPTAEDVVTACARVVLCRQKVSKLAQALPWGFNFGNASIVLKIHRHEFVYVESKYVKSDDSALKDINRAFDLVVAFGYAHKMADCMLPCFLNALLFIGGFTGEDSWGGAAEIASMNRRTYTLSLDDKMRFFTLSTQAQFSEDHH